MGKRGAAPRPSHELNDPATIRARQKLESSLPAASVPEFPAWADEQLRVMYDEQAELLSRYGNVTALDGPALYALVCAFRDFEIMRGELAHTPPVTLNGDGVEVASPVWKVYRETWERLDKAIRGFGLTPTTRANVLRAKRAEGEILPGGKDRFFKAKQTGDESGGSSK